MPTYLTASLCFGVWFAGFLVSGYLMKRLGGDTEEFFLIAFFWPLVLAVVIPLSPFALAIWLFHWILDID